MYIITIQESFEEVIEAVKAKEIDFEKFWLARRPHGSDGVLQFFSVGVSATKDDLKFEAESEDSKISLTFAQLAEHTYKVIIVDSHGSEEYHLRTPKQKDVFKSLGKITLSDLSAVNNHMYLGALDGNIYVYSLCTKSLTPLQKVYRSSVNRLLTFPSGKVLLSVGDYYVINLWDFSSEGIVPDRATRTFKKHMKPITDIAVIGRGRNFLSSSDDGTVMLWECSTESVVTTFRRISAHTDPVKCIALSSSRTEPLENQFRPDMLYECRQVVVFAGYELGYVQQYSIAQNCATNVRFKHTAAVTSICSTGDYVIAGFADGRVLVWNWVSDEKHFLDLDPTQAVEHLYLRNTKGVIEFEISNGPEMLLSIQWDANAPFKFAVTYLVGFQEMFEVTLVGACISTDKEVAIF